MKKSKSTGASAETKPVREPQAKSSPEEPALASGEEQPICTCDPGGFCPICVDSKIPEPLAAADLRTNVYLADLNAVLQWHRTTKVGAYAIAFVEVLVFQALGVVPTRYLLERVAVCDSLEQAVKVAEEWVQDRRMVQELANR